MREKILIAVVFVLLLVLAFILLKSIVGSQPNYIPNCTVAKERHLTNIPRGSVYYRPELDRNNNGFACET